MILARPVPELVRHDKRDRRGIVNVYPVHTTHTIIIHIPITLIRVHEIYHRVRHIAVPAGEHKGIGNVTVVHLHRREPTLMYTILPVEVFGVRRDQTLLDRDEIIIHRNIILLLKTLHRRPADLVLLRARHKMRRCRGNEWCRLHRSTQGHTEGKPHGKHILLSRIHSTQLLCKHPPSP